MCIGTGPNWASASIRKADGPDLVSVARRETGVAPAAPAGATSPANVTEVGVADTACGAAGARPGGRRDLVSVGVPSAPNVTNGKAPVGPESAAAAGAGVAPPGPSWTPSGRTEKRMPPGTGTVRPRTSPAS